MRRTALRAFAGLCAASWIVLPGFGAIDLAVTWSSEWPQVLEAGWGLFATVIVGAAFVAVAARPEWTASAVPQLAVAAVALSVSAIVAEETRLLAFAVALAVQVAVVRLLSRGVHATWALRARTSTPLLLLALPGVAPWLAYAWRMWAANREERIDADITVGVDHYSMQGALGLSLALLPLLAAVRPRLRPFSPICAAAAAFYLAVVSLAWPDAAAGLTQRWSVAAAAWAVGLVATALVERRRAPAGPAAISS